MFTDQSRVAARRGVDYCVGLCRRNVKGEENIMFDVCSFILCGRRMPVHATGFDGRSSSQEMPYSYCNPKVYRRVLDQFGVVKTPLTKFI
jgi:hypothetical protein